MSDLKPCPMCGSARVRTTPVRDGRMAVCRDCGTCGPREHFGPKTIPTAEERAIAAWNRRAPDPQAALSGTTPPDGLVEALEEIERLHIPDQPAYSADSELVWAKRHVANLRSIARAALTAHRGDKTQAIGAEVSK